MRHNVRYSNAAYQDMHEKNFETQKDAVEFVESIEKRYRYIWLSEFGEHQTGGGKWVTDWVDYWWSSAVTETEWGERPDAGWGRAAFRKYHTPYRPLFYKSKRFAHLNVRASPMATRVEAPSSQTKPIPSGSQRQRALDCVDSDSEAVPC
jgi:hypothetical protein